MTVGIVGLDVYVEKNETFRFVNLNVVDSVITHCNALLGLPKPIGFFNSQLVTVGNVADGEYPYSYTLAGHVIIEANPKIIVGG
jgi:hypothetical protein